MPADDRLTTIIKSALAGEPCMLPELTRAVAPGVDVARERAIETRAADLAGVYRQLAEEHGDGDELTCWVEANDESVASTVRGIATTARALVMQGGTDA